MAEPKERGPDLRLRAGRARDESTRVRAESQRVQRRAAQLVITAERLIGEAVVLSLEGALDVASARALITEVAAHRATGEAVRIDLAGVDFMDAYSLAALLELTASDGSPSGRVELTRPSEAVMRVVEITGAAAGLGLASG
jgi:anti-anti-sigma factor